jgi:S1-C subfamily serine protease
MGIMGYELKLAKVFYRLDSRHAKRLWGAASRLVAAAGIFIICTSIAFGQGLITPPPSPSEEINTALMHAAFLMAGQSKKDQNRTSLGTVFIMGIPRQDAPGISRAVLVTAHHVLDDIGTDEAVILARRRNTDGTYVTFQHNIQIRTNGKPHYVKHETADVAAMYVPLPNDVPITALTPDFLADDKLVEDIGLHPGDETFCLGFPLGVSSPGGFPILRTGHIASYPLTPLKGIKQIYFDLFLYGGNSGGPIYYYYTNRSAKGVTHLGIWQGILGLVTQQVQSREFADKPLNFGVIVPAPFIRETIHLLQEQP